MLKLKGKSLIFGDIHVGIKGDSLSRLHVTIKTIEEILKLAKRENVENIIFLGDWYNARGYIHSTTLTISQHLVELLAREHTLIFIAGNHDMESNVYRTISPLHAFKTIPNVTVVFDILEFQLNGKAALAVPWGYTEYATDKDYDYIFGHLTVAGSAVRYNRVVGGITDNSDYLEAPMNDIRTFSRLLAPNGICFSGHIHLRNEFLYRSNRIVFVGSPIELNFGETSSVHGVYILEQTKDGGDVLTFHELNNNIPKHELLKLSDCLDEKGDLKPTRYFEDRFSNKIIKKILDVELTSEQQTKLNDILSSIDIFDSVQSEICYQLSNSETGGPDDPLNRISMSSGKMTLSAYIDAVFNTLSDDIFIAAGNTKDGLKAKFDEYAAEL